MRTIERLFSEYQQQPGFDAMYYETCCLCPKTAEVMRKKQSRGLPWPEIAKITGISPERLRAFENADYCSYDLICRLCQAFEIAPPTDCQKKFD
jgi:hypothetical protein